MSYQVWSVAEQMQDSVSEKPGLDAQDSCAANILKLYGIFETACHLPRWKCRPAPFGL
jgi:hypothetical protein